MWDETESVDLFRLKTHHVAYLSKDNQFKLLNLSEIDEKDKTDVEYFYKKIIGVRVDESGVRKYNILWENDEIE